MEIVIGVDPGTVNTGYAVISADLKILQIGTVCAEGSLTQRLRQIGEDFSKIISHWKPSCVVVEKIFLGKNVQSVFSLGHARGVLIYEASKFKAEIFEYAAREVKKGITGNGNAEKKMVSHILRKQFNIPSQTELDATDALALAVHHVRHLEVKIAFARQGVSL